MSGTLWVVATPIGNLEDISSRAVAVLAQVSLIAAEDTRRTGLLLRHLGISTAMLSFHDHNERERVPQIIEHLNSGQDVALVSDAGTPLISDPGYRLVAGAREQGIQVSPVPGACAAIAALSVAGLPSDRFVFEGFLPAKSESRRKRLSELSGDTRTLILYETGPRILACLEDIGAIMGSNRRVVVARELTKQFETVMDGDSQAVVQAVAADPNQRKGEFVVLIAGADQESTAEEARSLLTELLTELPTSRAAKLAARITGADRRELYQLAEAIKSAQAAD